MKVKHIHSDNVYEAIRVTDTNLKEVSKFCGNTITNDGKGVWYRGRRGNAIVRVGQILVRDHTKPIHEFIPLWQEQFNRHFIALEEED